MSRFPGPMERSFREWAWERSGAKQIVSRPLKYGDCTMSYEHRLVDVVNNSPSGETYDAIGRDADAAIARLKSELAAKSAECDGYRRARQDALEMVDDGTRELIDLQKEHADLRAKLAASEADAAKMRGALVWVKMCPTPNDRIESASLIAALDKIVDAALATNAGAAWLEKYRAMERVCEAAKKMSLGIQIHNERKLTAPIAGPVVGEFVAALDDYRALCAKEQK